LVAQQIFRNESKKLLHHAWVRIDTAERFLITLPVLLLTHVSDIGTSILRPRSLIMTGGFWFLAAKANGLNLAVSYAVNFK